MIDGGLVLLLLALLSCVVAVTTCTRRKDDSSTPSAVVSSRPSKPASTRRTSNSSRPSPDRIHTTTSTPPVPALSPPTPKPALKTPPSDPPPTRPVENLKTAIEVIEDLVETAPLPSSNYGHERDSIVFAGMLSEEPLYVGACDGRYIFILDNERMTSVGIDRGSAENLTEDECMTITLHVIDCFTARKQTFNDVGDLFGYGETYEAIALNEHELVLLDYHEGEGLLRQRLIRIDWTTKTATCDFYRSYSMELEPNRRLFVAVGTKIAVIQSGLRAYTFPKDPFSTHAQTDISQLVAQVFGRMNTTRCTKPFIIADTAIGYFVASDDSFDLMNVAVVDLSAGEIYLQEVDPPLGSSRVEWERFSPLYTSGVKAFSQRMDNEIFMLANSVGFCAILDTRILRWTELKVELEIDEDAWWEVVCVEGGYHFMLFDTVNEMGGSRKVSGDAKGGQMGRARLIRHPLRVPPLSRLAAIAVQRSGAAESQLQHLADRFA